MYKKIVELIKYIVRHNEKDVESTEGRNLEVKVIENQDKSGGLVQVAPWISKFDIDSLNIEVMQENKFDFFVHFANMSKIYYLYTATYEDDIDRTILIEDIEGKPFIENCNNYLSFVVKLSTRVLHKIAPKLKEYVQSSAGKYPNFHMTYTESNSIRDEYNITENIIKMISEGIGEVIKYSLSSEIRKQIFDILEVNTSDAAVDKLYKLIRDTHDNTEEE